MEQALKIPFVAAVILALNLKRQDLAQEVILKATIALNEHFRTGAWREVKLLLRFLACLQGILTDEGIFPVLEELFSRSADLQAASVDDVSACPHLEDDHSQQQTNRALGCQL